MRTPASRIGAHVQNMKFVDRTEAGEALSRVLQDFRLGGGVVLAIPRGGIPVGAQVARHLGMAASAIVACKVPAPGHPELGMGAVAEGGVRQVDLGLAGVLKVAPGELRSAVLAAEEELKRRILLYRQGCPVPDLQGCATVLVDDGIARGVTMRAAIEAVKKLRPARLLVAAPVASAFAADSLVGMVDDVVTLVRPAVLRSVSEWYEDFSPVRDADVMEWLAAGRRSESGEPAVA